MMDFTDAVLDEIHRLIIWNQITRNRQDVVLCRTVDGDYVERSVLELSVYGVANIDHVYPDHVRERYVAMGGRQGYLVDDVETLPTTPLENLAAGFPIRVQCLHLEGLR